MISGLGAYNTISNLGYPYHIEYLKKICYAYLL